MSKPIRGQGGHLVFPIGPKNRHLVEDIDIFLPDKFCWIPFGSFRGEVENVSANQKPGWPSCFSDRPEKLCVAMLRRRHKNLVEDVEILIPVKFHWIPFSSFREEVENVKFQRRSQRRNVKVNDGWSTDGRTDDRQRIMHDHSSALEPLAEVH